MISFIQIGGDIGAGGPSVMIIPAWSYGELQRAPPPPPTWGRSCCSSGMLRSSDQKRRTRLSLTFGSHRHPQALFCCWSHIQKAENMSHPNSCWQSDSNSLANSAAFQHQPGKDSAAYFNRQPRSSEQLAIREVLKPEAVQLSRAHSGNQLLWLMKPRWWDQRGGQSPPPSSPHPTVDLKTLAVTVLFGKTGLCVYSIFLSG